jgi:hypothetical protein
MTLVKGSTKKGQNLLDRASNYEGKELYDVYSSFSKDKRDAYNRCRGLQYEYRGNNFRIISANSFAFSVAFDGEYENEPATFIITKDNDYVVLLNK